MKNNKNFLITWY